MDWESYVRSGSRVNEIEEEYSSEDFESNGGGSIKRLATIREEGSFRSFDFRGGSGREDAVYVAVRKKSEEETSMDALIWAINNLVIPGETSVFLIHVFPETKFIPTPLGNIPVSQVNPQQKEYYMNQERIKMREFLQKFISLCSSNQVQVDTVVVESDGETQALLDLIAILNIKKLVLGTNKSTIRKMMRSRRGGNGIAERILQNAPESCEVKIICEGKEMSELSLGSPSTSSSSSSSRSLTDSPSVGRHTDLLPLESIQDQQIKYDKPACGCFKI